MLGEIGSHGWRQQRAKSAQRGVGLVAQCRLECRPYRGTGLPHWKAIAPLIAVAQHVRQQSNGGACIVVEMGEKRSP